MAESIEQKLEAARRRERAARARTARLRRSLDRSNRKTQSQVRYIVGAAMIALAESGRGEQLVAGFRRWLDHYLTRSQDRTVLMHTPFELKNKEDCHGPRERPFSLAADPKLRLLNAVHTNRTTKEAPPTAARSLEVALSAFWRRVAFRSVYGRLSRRRS
jgi:hypothetical protein